MPAKSILSEFMTIAHPELPPTLSSACFVTSDLIQVTGCSKKSIEDWLKSGLLRASYGQGRRGKINGGGGNYHKFSERDLLVAGSICCFPPRAMPERRRLSEALYGAPILHRYILVTRFSVRLFDSLSTFADPAEWADPFFHIIDLRTLWAQMEKKYAKIAIRKESVFRALALEGKFSDIALPNGENARRIGG